jgi:tetratricopeptide (TPR) repeat protein
MEFERQEREREVRELLDRGYDLFKNGDYEQARAVYAKAVELAPRSAEAHAWLAAAYGRLIDEAWNLKDKIKLLPLLEEEIATALDIDPALPLARRMHGAKLLNTPDMLGGDPVAAAGEFRYCIERGMDDADIWVFLAECYLKSDEPEQAITALQEALAREPRHEQAIRWLEEARKAQE